MDRSSVTWNVIVTDGGWSKNSAIATDGRKVAGSAVVTDNDYTLMRGTVHNEARRTQGLQLTDVSLQPPTPPPPLRIVRMSMNLKMKKMFIMNMKRWKRRAKARP